MNAKLLLLPLLLSAVILLGGCTSVPFIQSCPASCDDNNFCTQDYCNASTNWTCAHPSFEGFSCNNATGICKAGACVNQTINGGGPVINYESRKAESDAYWLGAAEPFQVTESSQSANDDLNIVIRNVDPHQLRLNTISVSGGGFVGAYTTPTYLSPGEKRAFTISWNEKGICNTGDVYEYGVNFSYDGTGYNAITGQTQYGTRTIIGKCS